MICKVDALNFPITIFGPFKNETGFCIPYASCHALLEEAVIEKVKLNDTTDEVIFKIPLKTQLNGLWTCQYGDKNHEAVTEVTLQDIPSNKISGKENVTLFFYALEALFRIFFFTWNTHT